MTRLCLELLVRVPHAHSQPRARTVRAVARATPRRTAPSGAPPASVERPELSRPNRADLGVAASLVLIGRLGWGGTLGLHEPLSSAGLLPAIGAWCLALEVVGLLTGGVGVVALAAGGERP
jgi:hypothetical protein